MLPFQKFFFLHEKTREAFKNEANRVTSNTFALNEGEKANPKRSFLNDLNAIDVKVYSQIYIENIKKQDDF